MTSRCRLISLFDCAVMPSYVDTVFCPLYSGFSCCSRSGVGWLQVMFIRGPIWRVYPFPSIKKGELCLVLTVDRAFAVVDKRNLPFAAMCTLMCRGLWYLLIIEVFVVWGFSSSLWYSDVYRFLSVLGPSALVCECCTTSSLTLSSHFFLGFIYLFIYFFFIFFLIFF